ncbi:MAG: rubrerythrin [Fusobacteriaceae bacterium]
MELKGSKTEKNLKTAFAGESMARNKYTYYAAVARNEGYEHLAAIFESTANNEREHAKLWFKALHNNSVPDSLTNLDDASAGEHYEWTDMYINMAKDAEAEGFKDIAFLFNEVAKIEHYHDDRYKKLKQNIMEQHVFASEADQKWECMNCAHIYTGKKAPDICPVCKHPKSFFMLQAANY